MRTYPCVYMRGGTSKAVFFHEKDLPEDKAEWDEIFLKVMGSPDVKQIDGMGGTVSSTSKIAVISPSPRDDVDVNYTFIQVSIDSATVDYKGNCGNISSAVGPFAVDEGLVETTEPITVVRVLNTNTDKIIEEHVRIKDGKAAVYGTESIMGVPGTGSRIDMFFQRPGGSVTGKLFPTGNKIDTLDIPDYGKIDVTFIDCSNPVVLVRAEDIGLTATELLELNSNRDKMEHLERIRAISAEKVGMVDDWKKARDFCNSVPKIAFINTPRDYINLDGKMVKSEDMDICARVLSLGKVHKVYAMTAAIATCSAAKIKGTIAYDLLNHSNDSTIVRLGHASGTMDVDIKFDGEDNNVDIVSGGVIRTARRIMDGKIYIK